MIIYWPTGWKRLPSFGKCFSGVDLDAAKKESYQAVQDGTAGKTEWEQAEDWYSPLDACVETRLTIALMIK